MHVRLVRAESDAYLRSISVQQQWSETDPALQLLLLPRPDLPALPRYQPNPDYLDPSHCRLCLQAVAADEMPAHIISAHQIATMQEYRHQVFMRTMAEWPQEITPQILRCRLAAFKRELCDENFKELPCACCARMKRNCKLRVVQFPPASADQPPAWLPWDQDAWEAFREQRCDQLHELFSIERYLTRFFMVDEKVSHLRDLLRSLRIPMAWNRTA